MAADVPKVTIAFEQHSIEVNGLAFTLLKSDADIISDALSILEASENIDVSDRKAVLRVYRDMAGYIDTILGTGALAKISGGVPVGFAKLKECMGVIVDAVYTSYQTAIALKYGK